MRGERREEGREEERGEEERGEEESKRARGMESVRTEVGLNLTG